MFLKNYLNDLTVKEMMMQLKFMNLGYIISGVLKYFQDINIYYELLECLI